MVGPTFAPERGPTGMARERLQALRLPLVVSTDGAERDGVMRCNLLMVLALVTPAAANAAPIHFSCLIKDPTGGGKPFSLVADEAKQTVTFSVAATGFSQKLPAVFVDGTVRWLVDVPPGEYSFVLNLVDRWVGRTYRAPAAADVIEYGVCGLAPKP